MEPSVLKIFTVDLGWLRTLMGTKQWLLFWFRIRRFLKICLIGLKNFFHNYPRINAGASTLPWTSPGQRAMGSWLGSPRVLLPAGFSFQDVQIDQLHRDHFCSAGLILSSCFCTAAVSANALDCPRQPQGQQRFETRRASIAGGLPDRRQSSDHLGSIADRRPLLAIVLGFCAAGPLSKPMAYLPLYAHNPTELLENLSSQSLGYFLVTNVKSSEIIPFGLSTHLYINLPVGCFSQPSRGYILYESTYPPKLHFRSIQYVDLPNQEVMS
jgi:hypothetical protein